MRNFSVMNPRSEDVALICLLRGAKNRFLNSGSVGVLEYWSIGMELKEKSLKSGNCLRDLSLGPHGSGILESLSSNTPLLHHSMTPCQTKY